jgi:ketosteroid isomerase-like protein
MSEQAKLDAMIQDYLEAFNSGDYKRVASYWTEDAVHLPPMGERSGGGPLSRSSIGSPRRP